MFSLAIVDATIVELICANRVICSFANYHMIPRGHVDFVKVINLKLLFFVFTAGPTASLGKARFTKIQNGKKQDKHLLQLTKTRDLLRLKLTILYLRCSHIVYTNIALLLGMLCCDLEWNAPLCVGQVTITRKSCKSSVKLCNLLIDSRKRKLMRGGWGLLVLVCTAGASLTAIYRLELLQNFNWAWLIPCS